MFTEFVSLGCTLLSWVWRFVALWFLLERMWCVWEGFVFSSGFNDWACVKQGVPSYVKFRLDSLYIFIYYIFILYFWINNRTISRRFFSGIYTTALPFSPLCPLLPKSSGRWILSKQQDQKGRLKALLNLKVKIQMMNVGSFKVLRWRWKQRARKWKRRRKMKRPRGGGSRDFFLFHLWILICIDGSRDQLSKFLKLRESVYRIVWSSIYCEKSVWFLF